MHRLLFKFECLLGFPAMLLILLACKKKGQLGGGRAVGHGWWVVKDGIRTQAMEEQ